VKQINFSELRDFNVTRDNKGNIQRGFQRRNYRALNQILSQYENKIIVFTKLELLKLLNCQGTYNRYQARRQLCEQLEEKTNRIWIQRRKDYDWCFIAIPKKKKTEDKDKKDESKKS